LVKRSCGMSDGEERFFTKREIKKRKQSSPREKFGLKTAARKGGREEWGGVDWAPANSAVEKGSPECRQKGKGSSLCRILERTTSWANEKMGNRRVQGGRGSNGGLRRSGGGAKRLPEECLLCRTAPRGEKRPYRGRAQNRLKVVVERRT